MASSLPAPRERKRRICPKCKQELSHSAYARHQNPAVCPEIPSHDQLPTPKVAHLANISEVGMVEDACISTGTDDDFPSISPKGDVVGVEGALDANTESSLESGSEQDSNDSMSDRESDSEVCISDNEQPSSCDELEADDHRQIDLEEAVDEHQSNLMNLIIIHISMFLSFFQLCYRVSECGISLLLAFLRALLQWLSAICPNSQELRTLRDLLPCNVYYLQKLLGTKSGVVTFVVCPKCHSLYNYSDCVISHRSGKKESLKCSFIQYPQHPMLTSACEV